MAPGEGQEEDGPSLATLMLSRIAPIASACSGHTPPALLSLAGPSAAS